MRPYAIICIFISIFFLIACGTKPSTTLESKATSSDSVTTSQDTAGEAPVTLIVGGPSSPPSLPFLHMMEEKVLGDNVTIQFQEWKSIDVLMAMTQDPNINFIALPLNTALTLYNRGIPLQLMNVNTWSVMALLTTDPTVNTWEDLAGKTLYVPMQSSPVDYITQTFLKKHGLTPGEDITLIHTQLDESAQLLMSGKAQYLVSIQPQVTALQMKNPSIRSIADYKKEWQSLTGLENDLPNAGMAVKTAFASQNPEFTAKFHEEYKKALLWFLDNPAEGAALAQKYLSMDPEVVEKAIPVMALDFAAAADVQDVLEIYFKLLFDYSPASIGGELPDENFYYTK